MSDLIITPELALRLQTAAREASLCAKDIELLAGEGILVKILPLLFHKAEIHSRNPFTPFARVTGQDQFLSVEGAIQHLRDRGVCLNEQALQLTEETSYVQKLRNDETYDLYLVRGVELGLSINERSSRKFYETRAAAFGLELGPPALAIYALHYDAQFDYCHVASEPFSSTEYEALYFQILSSRELRLEVDALDSEAARRAFIAQETIPANHQWLFFKRV